MTRLMQWWWIGVADATVLDAMHIGSCDTFVILHFSWIKNSRWKCYVWKWIRWILMAANYQLNTSCWNILHYTIYILACKLDFSLFKFDELCHLWWHINVFLFFVFVAWSSCKCFGLLQVCDLSNLLKLKCWLSSGNFRFL